MRFCSLQAPALPARREVSGVTPLARLVRVLDSSGPLGGPPCVLRSGASVLAWVHGAVDGSAIADQWLMASRPDTRLLVADGDEVGASPEEQRVAGDGRGRHEGLTQLVDGDLFELSFGGDDVDVTVLAGEVDVLAVGHW